MAIPPRGVSVETGVAFGREGGSAYTVLGVLVFRGKFSSTNKPTGWQRGGKIYPNPVRNSTGRVHRPPVTKRTPNLTVAGACVDSVYTGDFGC